MTDDTPAGALPLWLWCRVHGFPGPEPPAVPGVAPEDVAAELARLLTKGGARVWDTIDEILSAGGWMIGRDDAGTWRANGYREGDPCDGDELPVMDLRADGLGT